MRDCFRAGGEGWAFHTTFAEADLVSNEAASTIYGVASAPSDIYTWINDNYQSVKGSCRVPSRPGRMLAGWRGRSMLMRCRLCASMVRLTVLPRMLEIHHSEEEVSQGEGHH